VFHHENVGGLKKANYRLSHAPLLWGKRRSVVLVSMGFGCCEVGVCVYARKVGFCIVVVYVNNLLICGKGRGCGNSENTVNTPFHDYKHGEPKIIVGWNINKNQMG
jgi:hypothetical protein